MTDDVDEGELLEPYLDTVHIHVHMYIQLRTNSTTGTYVPAYGTLTSQSISRNVQ
jgi:hypothetical protein